ncbi:MAG: hypothetical protein FRX49_04174 [Trebouxia sp. A1-2]|nr:MAG: hypothetical protein FRX49_04174 [Trebouxia sp. A1-2]
MERAVARRSRVTSRGEGCVMSWECLDALNLLTDLQEACNTEKAELAIGKAKNLWQKGSTEEAFELVLNTLEDTSSQLALQLPIIQQLKGKITTASLHIDNIEKRLNALEKSDAGKAKAIKQLQSERDQARLAKDKMQQKILLGQIAYTVSDILEEYVYGDEGSDSLMPIPVSDFAQNNVRLTDEQQERWGLAEAFFKESMPIKDMVQADKYLRWLRSEPAHGKLLEKDTTAAQLHKWAGMHCRAKAVAPVQKYVQLLNRLSSNNHPLVPNRHLAHLVSKSADNQ